MNPATCLSSDLMSRLLLWRNPNGPEENWREEDRIENARSHILKVIITEIALAILSTTATAETIIYSSLTFPAFLLYPFNDTPFNAVVELLESSTFTALWGTADALIYNLFFLNVLTRESFARHFAQMLIPRSLQSYLPSIFRPADMVYILNWHTQQQTNPTDPMLRPLIQAGEDFTRIIKDGANFIVKEVLANATEDELQQFKEMNLSFYMYLATKTVYIYALGDKKNHSAPKFLKNESRKDIFLFPHDPILKEHLQNEEILKELKLVFENQEKFNVGIEKTDAKKVFNKLRNIASKELQNSIFVTYCWQKAIEIINHN